MWFVLICGNYVHCCLVLRVWGGLLSMSLVFCVFSVDYGLEEEEDLCRHLITVVFIHFPFFFCV